MNAYRIAQVTVLLLAVSLPALPAPAQGTQGASSQPARTFQPRPAPVEHLYWHFLVYVHTLDAKAAELDAQGKDSSWLRNDLQRRLRFSDADFAPIRASSQRLAPALDGLNAQARTIRAAGPATAKSRARMKALAAQREGYVNQEIAGLRQTLPIEKQASLEAFLVQFFAPKKVTANPSSPASKEAQQ